MKQEIALRLLLTLGAIFAVAGAWVLGQWAVRGRTASQSRMGTRFLVEVGILAGIWGPAYLGGGWLLAGVLLLAGLCTRELYTTLKVGGEQPWAGVGIALALGSILFVYQSPDAVGWLFPVALGLYGALRWIVSSRGAAPDSPLARVTSTGLGFVYPGLCLAAFLSLGLREEGFGYAIFFYGLVEANDVFAYLVGSGIGKRKIFPVLSPNKTLEGVVGGLLGTVAVGFAFSFAVPGFGPWRVASAAILIGLAGLGGDLFASSLKRRAGVKDYGNLVPTQGGVLDVYDAFFFVTPVFYGFLELTSG
ncbi:MAG: phosphatidate cytidylyltransferase [Myxococcota bacterium]|nr:phosphatidate cytidylyltransferase [Myxococcota bacterium]